MTWREEARCWDSDWRLFFPQPGNSTDPDPGAPRSSKQAREVCRECAVWRECLQWAIGHNVDSGVWGGASPGSRAKFTVGQIGGWLGRCAACGGKLDREHCR